ncbi:MAG: methyl-accepting chemotaxis protein, partial [Treponema sp.]|nr:methyl-accepting chemotaxis protein [Treponema sp.]
SFGMSLGLRCLIYLIIPWIYITIVSYMMAQQYFANYIVTDADRFSMIARNIVITLINAAFYLKLCMLVRKKLCDYADSMGEKLEEIINEKDPTFYIETNLFDSLQYSKHLVNETSKGFTSLISHIKDISLKIQETSNNLAAISRELQATANEQNTSVTEINAIVRDMNSSIKDIRVKVESVASSCESMDSQMLSSLGSVSENLEQIGRIDESNKKIISCVDSLSRQASSIDEVMNLIEDIASQTRIIAFNAELEAVGAGKAGRNFHIVSSEIKRLADSVVESTKEIQRHIKDLKDASAALSSSSKNTTMLIESEMAMSKELEEHLKDIKNCAEGNSIRAAEIKNKIEGQSQSFEEITGSLEQINESISSLTVSTAEINSAASQIQAASSDLDSLE